MQIHKDAMKYQKRELVEKDTVARGDIQFGKSN
jgi:hypothetical protein